MFSVSCVGDTSGVLEHYTVLSHIGIGADLFHDYVGVSDSATITLTKTNLEYNLRH